jgi:hypothetical protein
MTSASMAMPTRRVEVWFGGVAPQNRLTVFFRIFLAIPQLIVLLFLGIAAFFVVLIGWFGALFTGRLPEFAHKYMSGFIRWEIRVNAYLFLMTDSYPPFTFEDVEYPVRVIMPERGDLNRLTVLFRFFIALPALIFAQIVVNGLSSPLLFIMWIIVVVSGKMPVSLYPTYAALVRYQARFHSWYNMVTSEYSWGMLGDAVPPPQVSSPPPPGAFPGAAPTAAPQPPQDAPQPPQDAPQDAPPTAPPAQPFSYPAPGSTGAQAPTPPSYPPPQAPPPMPPPGPPGAMPPPTTWERSSTAASFDPLRPWSVLVLQGAARGWMIFAIVWGSLVTVGQVARDFGHKNNNTNNAQLNTVPADAGLIHVIQTPPGT